MIMAEGGVSVERLTKRDIDGCLIHPWSFNGINGSYDIWDEELMEKQIDRLAAYEDTGLEPEKIKKHEAAYNECLTRTYGPFKQKISQWLQAEQDGRLVVLPCKVGDHVLVDGRDAIVENFFGYETERYLHTQFFDNMQYIDIPFDEIGKTAFLTREEAEAELAGKGGAE